MDLGIEWLGWHGAARAHQQAWHARIEMEELPTRSSGTFCAALKGPMVGGVLVVGGLSFPLMYPQYSPTPQTTNAKCTVPPPSKSYPHTIRM